MGLHIKTFTFNPFQENTYVLYNHAKHCVIIDPGCFELHEQQELSDFIEQEALKPMALLNTHAHIDHVLGNAFVSRMYQPDYYLHAEDLVTLQRVGTYAHVYGLGGYEQSPEPTFWLKGGEKLSFGDIQLEVLFTPGHAPGHVVFYNQENQFVINGDVLFNGSFGRVDLPGGDLNTLKKSITEILFSLPDETVVYCGHGPSTTIGKEKQTNPILMY